MLQDIRDPTLDPLCSLPTAQSDFYFLFSSTPHIAIKVRSCNYSVVVVSNVAWWRASACQVKSVRATRSARCCQIRDYKCITHPLTGFWSPFILFAALPWFCCPVVLAIRNTPGSVIPIITGYSSPFFSFYARYMAEKKGEE